MEITITTAVYLHCDTSNACSSASGEALKAINVLPIHTDVKPLLYHTVFVAASMLLPHAQTDTQSSKVTHSDPVKVFCFWLELTLGSC